MIVIGGDRDKTRDFKEYQLKAQIKRFYLSGGREEWSEKYKAEDPLYKMYDNLVCELRSVTTCK